MVHESFITIIISFLTSECYIIKELLVKTMLQLFHYYHYCSLFPNPATINCSDALFLVDSPLSVSSLL